MKNSMTANNSPVIDTKMCILNNFWSTCVSTVVCRLPMDVGPCRERYDRWYFDSERSTCQPFVYGGCAGNMNRFKSFESCTTFCSPSDRTRPAEPAPSYPSPSTSNGFSFISFSNSILALILSVFPL
jgi:hypothetical protein